MSDALSQAVEKCEKAYKSLQVATAEQEIIIRHKELLLSAKHLSEATSRAEALKADCKDNDNVSIQQPQQSSGSSKNVGTLPSRVPDELLHRLKY